MEALAAFHVERPLWLLPPTARVTVDRADAQRLVPVLFRPDEQLLLRAQSQEQTAEVVERRGLDVRCP